jgi:hypothetical protein
MSSKKFKVLKNFSIREIRVKKFIEVAEAPKPLWRGRAEHGCIFIDNQGLKGYNYIPEKYSMEKGVDDVY